MNNDVINNDVINKDADTIKYYLMYYNNVSVNQDTLNTLKIPEINRDKYHNIEDSITHLNSSCVTSCHASSIYYRDINTAIITIKFK